MAQYQITLSDDLVHGLFKEDGAMARLLEQVLQARVIRIFPNGDSAERLLGALLMEQDETWSTGRLYFDMRAYLEWKQGQPVSAVGDVAAAAVAAS